MTDDEAGGCYHMGRFFRGECPIPETGRQVTLHLCIFAACLSCKDEAFAFCAIAVFICVLPGVLEMGMSGFIKEAAGTPGGV